MDRAEDPFDRGGRLPEEPVPADVVAGAKAAFGRRTADTDIATLVFDSVDDAATSVQPRRLRFEHPEVGLEVHVTSDGDRRTISARCIPSAPFAIEIEHHTIELPPTTTSGDGRFVLDARPGDLLRLNLVSPAGATSVRTEWFRI